MFINRKIKDIVKRLKILYKNIPVDRVLQDRGIVVVPISGIGIFKGASKMYCGVQYIFIDTKLSPTERLVTLVHELGHSILHPNVDTYELKLANAYYFLTKYENQAHLFAAEYLLPDSIINDFNSCSCEVGEGKSISDIANEYGVTEELVSIKLNKLDPTIFAN